MSYIKDSTIADIIEQMYQEKKALLILDYKSRMSEHISFKGNVLDEDDELDVNHFNTPDLIDSRQNVCCDELN